MNTQVPKKDGSGAFGAVTLVYNDQFGEKVKNIAHYKLQNNPTLGTAIKALKTGDVVWLTTTGYDVTSIDTSNPNPTATGGGSPWAGKKSSNYGKPVNTFDQFGAQVGNALNVAAQLISNKVTETKDLKTEAIKVLQIGEELKATLQAGTSSKMEQVTPTVAPIDAPQFDEELNDEVPF